MRIFVGIKYLIALPIETIIILKKNKRTVAVTCRIDDLTMAIPDTSPLREFWLGSVLPFVPEFIAHGRVVAEK